MNAFCLLLLNHIIALCVDIGGERQMFMDSNFPLEGPVSAVGRSIVIFGPERSAERFACANIEPDKDIIKYVNIMKPPRFVLWVHDTHKTH